ncbi:hypothetical protein HS125_20275 [bacterium]|nr:hypothetical protein [bacterium]
MCAALLPCVFATGSEETVARSIPGFPASPRRASRCAAFSGRRPAAMRPTCPAFSCQQGRAALAVLLGSTTGLSTARLRGAPAAIPRFQRIFLSDPLPGGSNGKYQVLGNMMVDAARLRCPDRRPAQRQPPTLGIFTGSRDYMVKHMLPFFTMVAGHVSATRPEVRWLLGKADYVTLEMLTASAADPAGRLIEGENARWEPAPPYGRLISDRGVVIEVLPPGEVMARADLILTIPGTNTAELTALGIPMIVLVPTYYAEVHPMPGVLGHVGRLPILGRYVKRACALAYHRHVRYHAHPNRKRRAEVVPEISGRITSRQVADRVCAMLVHPLEPMEAELASIMGPPGATGRLVDEVLSWMRERITQ